MKKYILGILMFASVCACSKEDWPDNSAPERNWLAPEEGATDETSVLRKEFYDRNGIYLLFSDTLGVRKKTTLAGETVYSYQILGYDIVKTDFSKDSFSYHYYTTLPERQKAVEFVEEYILPNISEMFWPGAVLLLDKLEYYKQRLFPVGFYDAQNLTHRSKLQAMLLGIGNVGKKTEEEKETLKNAILQAMVIDKVSVLPAEDLEPFYSYSEEYYNVNGFSITDKGLTYASLGFLPKLKDKNSISKTSKDYDLAAFVERIFAISKEEFYDQFRDAPLVIRKMEALVDVLHKYGVKIYMEE